MRTPTARQKPTRKRSRSAREAHRADTRKARKSAGTGVREQPREHDRVATERTVRRIDFYKLSREKQERFLASTKGSAPPASIVHRAGDGGRTVRFAVASGVAAIALVILYLVRFGVLGASLAVHPPYFILIDAALAFVVPFAALRAIGSWRAAKLLPYKPGVYVFPMCLVDARDKTLRIFAMTDIASIGKATPGGSLRLSFRGGRSFSFAGGDSHNAEMLNRGIDNSQEQVKHALATSDDTELTTLDPFYDAKKGWTSPIGPKEPMIDRAPAWRRFDWAIALGMAVAFGPMIWFVHNKSSDDAMLKKAIAESSPEAFQSYLSVGKRHTEDVAGTLLPRAELERAKGQQSVEAITAFITAHPQSAIDREAQDALREALLRELGKAKKGASLASLAVFEKKYPNHKLGAEIAGARHDLYTAAVARFRANAPSDDAQLLAFVQRLAKQLELKGTNVTVIFRREVSPALVQADKLMAGAPSNRAFGAKQVTKYFDPTADQPKEADVVAAFNKAMRTIFSPDLIDVKMGPDMDDAAQAAAAAKDPLVAVRYRFGWLGTAYTSQTFKRAFAGIHVGGEATFTLPDGGAPVRSRIEVPPARQLPVQYAALHDGLSAPPAEEANPEVGVYAATDLRALDHIATILENTFIKPAAK